MCTTNAQTMKCQKADMTQKKREYKKGNDFTSYLLVFI